MKHAGGVRRASNDLLQALRETGVSVEVDQWIDRARLATEAPEPSTSRRILLRLSDGLRELRGRPPDSLTHSLYYDLGAPLCRTPLVVTVHDMVHERFGHGSRWLPIAKRAAVNRADVVVAVSQTTATDVHQFFPSADSVVVIPHGLSRQVLAQPQLEPESPRSFVLYVGHRIHHKNFELLLRAYRSSPELRALPLVIVGGPALDENEAREIRSATGRPIDHRTGIDDGQLIRLYDQALVTVITSRWEGFGLPVLEAMARHSPVACSGIGSLEEIADGHASLFDPESAEDCAQAVLRATHFSAEDRASAATHAQTFTWEAAAAAHRSLYERLVM